MGRSAPPPHPPMTNLVLDLFDEARTNFSQEPIADGAWLLHGFALAKVGTLLTEIGRIKAAAPFRHWLTPGGLRMSVAMTNCGALGWVSDRRGYRYTTHDPLSGQPWPPMPSEFSALAGGAARAG